MPRIPPGPADLRPASPEAVPYCGQGNLAPEAPERCSSLHQRYPSVSTAGDEHGALLALLHANRAAAHAIMFAHRHPTPSPDFHRQWIADIHHPSIPKLLLIGFRESAKSTLVEEALTLRALMGECRNALIVGENWDRATDRLYAIKEELSTNPMVLDLFGDPRGPVWGADYITLANGTSIRALGRGQAVRGIKHKQYRPDFLFLDDMEDEEAVRTDEAIAKTMRWLYGTLFPAMDKRTGLVRVAGSIFHPNSAIVQLSRDKAYKTHIVPVWHDDPVTGARVSSWPGSAPLPLMEQKQEEYERLGLAREFAQEYLCVADTEKTTMFKTQHLPVDPSLRRAWQPVMIIIDPARTVKKSSSLTGAVAVSWSNRRLIVWEGWGELWRPDDIINFCFDADLKYNPVAIYIERDGLEEFLLQPLRQAMVTRNRMLPLEPVRAPKGKDDFIRGLQPFIDNGEVILAQECPQLQAQLKNFPAGKKDTLNALAYALIKHPGTPVIDPHLFRPDTVIMPEAIHDLPRSSPLIMAMSATAHMTAGVLIAMAGRQMHILADAVVQGAPTGAAGPVIDALMFASRRHAPIVLPKRHFAPYDNLGLRSAVMRIPLRPAPGGDEVKGRQELCARMERDNLRVADNCTWVLRAMSGGYAYEPGTQSVRDNVYAVIMEAIEAALPAAQYRTESSANATTADGRPYTSALVRR